MLSFFKETKGEDRFSSKHQNKTSEIQCLRSWIKIFTWRDPYEIGINFARFDQKLFHTAWVEKQTAGILYLLIFENEKELRIRPIWDWTSFTVQKKILLVSFAKFDGVKNIFQILHYLNENRMSWTQTINFNPDFNSHVSSSNESDLNLGEPRLLLEGPPGVRISFWIFTYVSVYLLKKTKI